MREITLNRIIQTNEATIGLISGLVSQLVTLELPWRDNATNISAIPPGSYQCEWTMSPKFKRSLYILRNVQNRSGIRIHPANWTKELQGCIALGSHLVWDKFQKQPKLNNSASSVEQFHKELEFKPFLLNIRG